MKRLEPQALIDTLPEDSWFRRYLTCWPTAEQPKSYLLFSAMCMFGACLGRRVWYTEDYRKLWPMLNLLLIGPSGIGKSSSIHIGRSLLDSLPVEDRPQFILGGATPEKLHEDLVLNSHAVLFASELANFFSRQKYMEGMIPYVTELLDYQPVEKRKKSGLGVYRIEEPTVTVVGGSTVDWLQDQLPDSAVGGGFLARFLIVKEEHRAQRVAIPEMALSRKARLDLEHHRAKVFADFYRIVKQAGGEVAFSDYGAADVYAKWYLGHQPINNHLAPFAARAPEFVRRLSLLVALSAGRHSISETDLEAGIALYTYTESRLQEVVVPMSVVGKMQSLVLQSVPEQGATSLDIRRSMRSYMKAQEVEQYLSSLVANQDLILRDGKYFRT